MTDQAKERIFVGVPAAEVDDFTKSLYANGAISVVNLPEPGSDTHTLIGTLAPDRTHFRTVAEFTRTMVPTRARAKAATAGN
jgi:hypothetical protein